MIVDEAVNSVLATSGRRLTACGRRVSKLCLQPLPKLSGERMVLWSQSKRL